MKTIAENANDFADLRTLDGGNCVYVDKTDYFHRLVTSPGCRLFFIARPRRFGKSLMITTFKAIFEGRRELFKGLKIDRTDYDWKVHPVIHLDFSFCAAATCAEFLEGLPAVIEDALADPAEAAPARRGRGGYGLAVASALALSALTAAALPKFNVRDFGAKGDGVASDTVAIQKAIDAAHAAGGGEVVLPRGRFLSGTLYLRSNVEFNLRGGSWLVGSRDPADYNRWDFCPQNNRSESENHEGGHLLVCLEQTNVTVRGTGIIDGNGRYFMTNGYDPSRIGRKTGTNGLGGVNGQDAIKWRPAQMLWFCESKGIRLEGFTAWDSPYWSVLLHGCEDVDVRYLQIRTSRENPRVDNGDGLNIDCCRHVRVSECYIETSDDALCLRAAGKRLRNSPEETFDVTVRNCTLSSLQEAFRIGVGDGPIRDCRISDCVIRDSVRGINFSSTWFPSRGCSFRNITFENIVCDCSSSFLRIHRLMSAEPDVESLHFRNIRGTQGRPSYIWSRKGKPFRDITLENVDVNGTVEVMNVEGFRLERSTLRRMDLTPREIAERDGEIERFDTLLY